MSYLLAKELKRSKYRLLGLVGQGQFGRVYCAIHRKVGRLVALKELDKQRFPTHKFLRELRFLLSLQHDNIVTCHALEHTSTGRYLVMDYCEGGTLRGLMEEDVRLHPQQCLKLVTDVLFGLDHAHSRGIVHCDIKPENLLLTLQADGWTARISDFGIARLHQESSSEGTGNTGSPAYMAPERFYGQYSVTSDLYAVGILLFELLAGYRPFSGVPAVIMAAHLNHPVKIPDTIPAALQVVILTALQKLPARRFQSAAQMLAAIRIATREIPIAVEQTWTDARLLRSPLTFPTSLCRYVKQEVLQAEVQQLVIPMPDGLLQADVTQVAAIPKAVSSSERVYQVCESYVGCRIYPEGLLVDAGAAPPGAGKHSLVASVRLPTAVKELLVRPQGCFAITQRSIYRMPIELFESGVAQHEHKRRQQSVGDSLSLRQTLPELVAEFSRDFFAAIESKGRWMAVAVLEPDKVTSVLGVWNLAHMQSMKSSNRYGAAKAPRLTAPLFHLAMVDSRHLVAFSHLADQGIHPYTTGVLLEVFTRRGNPVSTFNLPIPLRHLLGGTAPYSLLALEPGHIHSVLLINLKPLKLLRIGVDIVPILMTAASWGYVLMAADGQIVLLDSYGQIIGRIAGPAHPTAIAVLEPCGLLIATWQNGQGELHTVDLRQLEIGLLF